MKSKFILFLVALVWGMVSCQNTASENTFSSMALVQAPIGSQQMAPALFLNSQNFSTLGIEEGDVCSITLNEDKQELRVYTFLGGSNEFALRYKYGEKRYKLKTVFNLKIKRIKSDSLSPKSLEHKVETFEGDLEKWDKIAIGTPHGDCDLNTAEIGKILNESYGIPLTAAYLCRYTAKGIWYDCNRPLMKLPNPKGGTIPERVWNDDAINIYENYQNRIFENSQIQSGERFEFYTSFHGHDLTVTLDDGRKISRDVMEALGVGFTRDELRRIKTFYNQNANKYFNNPPALYFGNLEEDREYEFAGKTVDFFYSGLGTRMYGSMRSNLIKRGIHIETPNSIRLNPDVWPHTAAFLGDIYTFVRDSIIANSKEQEIPTMEASLPALEKIAVSGGEFIRGAEDCFGWSSEHPQHQAYVDDFKMDKYEVTNIQYADFLNEAFEKDLVTVNEGVVYSPDEKILFKTQDADAFSQIKFEGTVFSVISGKRAFPVVFVSWYGAKAYADYYNWTLPTEAQWEYAASWDNSAKQKYRYGTSKNIMADSDANYMGSGDSYENHNTAPETTPVGYYSTHSPSGLYDMSGNVWEWCSDYYVYKPYREHPNDDVWRNPFNNKESTMNVVRGGAWDMEFSVLRSTIRLGINPEATLINLGFRCIEE